VRTWALVALAGVVVAASSAAPAAAASSQLPDGGVPESAGRRPVELKAPTPDWYTLRLHRRVVAAARRGEAVPIPDGAEVPAAMLSVDGIRPGAWMLFPAWCTMNFVYGDSSDYYIGTAGHCTRPDGRVTIVAAPGVLLNIGRTVKRVNGGIGNDFALVDVRPSMEKRVRPSMAIVGGPTGSRSPRFGDPVVHVGHGVGVGTGGTPRAGVVTYTDGTKYGWDGVANLGDSGSPVRHAGGRAAGNLTHLVAGTKYLPANVVGTSIGRMNAIAGKRLATARLVTDP
jgi:hypothetical protein